MKGWKIISSSINSQPIAFFDSGVGGLTVFEKLKKLLPSEDYLYFGDTKNMPYGEKTKEQLMEFSDKIFKFFEKQGVKAVVMACNTTSATVYDSVKDKYNFKIYPVIQSVAKIIAGMDVKRIGVLATMATINSHAYSREIYKYNPEMEVLELACPQWVRIVEEKRENDKASEDLIKQKLAEMLWHAPEKVILGCTHYPYLTGVLTKYAPAEIFIDPAEYFAQFIKKDLKESNLLNPQSAEGFEKFYVSASPENFKNAGSMFYEIKTEPELIKL